MVNSEIKAASIYDIENICIEAELYAGLLGFTSYDEYLKYKLDAAGGLMRFGGSFALPLGQALYNADAQNSFKILRAFAETCKHHAMLYQLYIEKREINNESTQGG